MRCDGGGPARPFPPTPLTPERGGAGRAPRGGEGGPRHRSCSQWGAATPRFKRRVPANGRGWRAGEGAVRCARPLPSLGGAVVPLSGERRALGPRSRLSAEPPPARPGAGGHQVTGTAARAGRDTPTSHPLPLPPAFPWRLSRREALRPIAAAALGPRSRWADGRRGPRGRGPGGGWAERPRFVRLRRAELRAGVGRRGAVRPLPSPAAEAPRQARAAGGAGPRAGPPPARGALPVNSGPPLSGPARGVLVPAASPPLAGFPVESYFGVKILDSQPEG